MEDQLRKYVNEYGFTGVLEILAHLAEEKQNIQPDERKSVGKRYEKAKFKFWFLTKKKFMQGL